MSLGMRLGVSAAVQFFYEVGLLTPRPTPNLEGQDAVLSGPSPTDLRGMVRPTRNTRLPLIQL